MRKGLVVFIFLFASFLFLIGCTSQCIIDSDPQGASIKIDNEIIGQTPISYGFSTVGFRDTYTIQAFKEGYDTESQIIRLNVDVFWGTKSWTNNVFFKLRKK